MFQLAGKRSEWLNPASFFGAVEGETGLLGPEGERRPADLLFMRRVLLRKSLTVIPLMK